MKQSITVNGKTYEVEIGDLMASPVEVTVNGKKYSVEMDFSSGVPAPAAPAAPVAAAPVAAPVRAAKPAPAPVAAGSGDDVRAPMPGTILNVAVKPGDKVTTGQTLCFLEAMKMKNAIKSPREATIAGVEVTDGQKVTFGEVLVRFA